MQPNIPNLIELVIEKGLSKALADDHDGFTDNERLEFFKGCVMNTLQSNFSFLEMEDEWEDDD